ncbi:MAG: hypothetical protein SO193_03565 [Sodaliphilus sp.]|nr:hypothetical protein [Sodaliphilus sp.]MDY4780678.1 hypothetical protein [Sodaliphilus sp.]MDY6023123.1 hypothetical protein [Sodaliphilus sp.]
MNQMISARTLRVLRIVGVVYMLLAIAYLVMPLDLDRVGWMGYIDDFFLFMSAFTFMNGAFQKAERAFIRRQLFQLSAVFFVLCPIWILILTSID